MTWENTFSAIFAHFGAHAALQAILRRCRRGSLNRTIYLIRAIITMCAAIADQTFGYAALVILAAEVIYKNKRDKNMGLSRIKCTSRAHSQKQNLCDMRIRGTSLKLSLLFFEGHIFIQFCSSEPSGQSIRPSQNWLWEMQIGAGERGQSTEGVLQVASVTAGGLDVGGLLFVEEIVCSLASLTK